MRTLCHKSLDAQNNRAHRTTQWPSQVLSLAQINVRAKILKEKTHRTVGSLNVDVWFFMQKGWSSMEGQANRRFELQYVKIKREQKVFGRCQIIIAKTISHTALIDLCFVPSPLHVAFWIPSETPLTKDNISLPLTIQLGITSLACPICL